MTGPRIGVRRVAELIARLVLGGVFLYAGATKLLEPAEFAQAIANYRMLPAALIGPIAVVLPGVEVVCALALIAGIRQRAAVVLIQAMLVVFLVGLLQAIARDIDTSCGCFGAGTDTTPLGWGDVLRDVVMMGVGALAWPTRVPRDEPPSG